MHQLTWATVSRYPWVLKPVVSMNMYLVLKNQVVLELELVV